MLPLNTSYLTKRFDEPFFEVKKIVIEYVTSDNLYFRSF